MKSTINFFIKSVAAGWCIGLGGLINLNLSNKYAGAIAFSIGIYMVMCFKMKLVTGFVPAISLSGNYSDLYKRYPICLIGNAVGTYILAASVRCQKNTGGVLSLRAANIMTTKTTPLSALVGGIGCGIIIGLIVLNSNNIMKWILAAPLIAVFILTNMEHCVALTFYMFIANSYKCITDSYELIHLLFVILGNLIGGLAIGYVAKIKEME